VLVFSVPEEVIERTEETAETAEEGNRTSSVNTCDYTVTPGSHMPPTYLRQSRRYCLGYRSDIREYNADGNKFYRRSLPPACLRSWIRVNFAGMTAVKTGMISVAGDFCSHIGTVSQSGCQALPATMSQVGRRHMRTRLNPTTCSGNSEQLNGNCKQRIERSLEDHIIVSYINWKCINCSREQTGKLHKMLRSNCSMA